MFPVTFDRQTLSLLPPMDEALEGRVLTVLRAIVNRRLLPYFANQDDISQVQLARTADRHRIARFDDHRGTLDLVSFVAADRIADTVYIHDRIFDYIAFCLPTNPLQAFALTTAEASRAMALSELVLYHGLEQIVRPGRRLIEVIGADRAFVELRRREEPRYADDLKQAFEDSSNGMDLLEFGTLVGIDGECSSTDEQMMRRIREHVPKLTGLPGELLLGVYGGLGAEDRGLLLEACFAEVTDERLPVARRSRRLQSVVSMFHRQKEIDEAALPDVFTSFVEAAGRQQVIRELEIAVADDAEPAVVFDEFVARFSVFSRAAEQPQEEAQLAPALEGPHLSAEWPEPDSLKDRIEAARQDPRIPQSVKRAIDNNKRNIESHSSAKYTEFIETLLAIPWGQNSAIGVGPREFAAGLDAGHFGLAAPKELLADFFANLIWRYRSFDGTRQEGWARNGSAFLFVGPPGVGKTSLAISIARNLALPHHKISLGGLRDESALRGHGFTYEGSKPGAIVQGLVKMGVMNGVFILDEADKAEAMAVATLLEILDPEQNHLFHDKYTLSTVDIDLSNCHFILTANTLDTVPAPVIDRCQVVHLDRYSIEEKVEVARQFILPRLRKRLDIDHEAIEFEEGCDAEHLRFIIRAYTHEAGVRQLELALRGLLLRLQRRNLFEADRERVVITHRLIKETMDAPAAAARINADDRVGEVLGLGVNPELGIGSVMPVQATRILSPGGSESSAVSVVHATGNLEKVMDESRRVATTAILHCADHLGIDAAAVDVPVHLHVLGGSTKKDGPSAGTAISLALASQLSGAVIRRDVAVTGEVDTQGRVSGVGGIDAKIEAAISAGCKTVLIPAENLTGPGGIDRLPAPLRDELLVLEFDDWRRGSLAFDHARHTIQVVAVDHILQAFEVAVHPPDSLESLHEQLDRHAQGFSPVDRQPCPMTVLLKDYDEVSGSDFPAGLCARCEGCEVLVRGSARDQVLSRLEGRPGARVVQLGDAEDDFERALKETAAAHEMGPEPLVIVAPYFALKGVDLGAVAKRRNVLAFANNYVNGLGKLKAIKPAVNRLVCRLLHLGLEALEAFPMMRLEDGVYVLDLAAVPESVRLEPGRCAEVVGAAVDRWISRVDSGLESPPGRRA